MGMVRQWQDLTYESSYSNSYSCSLPDVVKLAEAYGWTGLRIDTLGELEDGIRTMIDTPGPVIVDCRVAKLANCFPMIPSGAAPTEMILPPSDVTGTMDDEPRALVGCDIPAFISPPASGRGREAWGLAPRARQRVVE